MSSILKKNPDFLIKESPELLVLSSADDNSVYFLDPTTMGIKETFKV